MVSTLAKNVRFVAFSRFFLAGLCVVTFGCFYPKLSCAAFIAFALKLYLALRRSSFDPGRYSGMPQKLRNQFVRNKLTTVSCTPAVTSQYKLKAAGKVIQIGTEMKGNK